MPWVDFQAGVMFFPKIEVDQLEARQGLVMPDGGSHCRPFNVP